MDRAAASWRIGLRAYLTASLIENRPVTVGELVELFGDRIPLHSAARKWAAHYSAGGEVAFPSAGKMRFYMLTQHLHWLHCRFEPAGRKTWQTRVLPVGKICTRCGSVFVNEKNTSTCGVLCPPGLRAQ